MGRGEEGSRVDWDGRCVLTSSLGLEQELMSRRWDAQGASQACGLSFVLPLQTGTRSTRPKWLSFSVRQLHLLCRRWERRADQGKGTVVLQAFLVKRWVFALFLVTFAHESRHL